MAADLHTHSTFSDGSNPAELLPWLAARAGLTALAISDHDDLHGVRFAYEHPTMEGVELIPATELTAIDPKRGRRVHLLCYWPDDCAVLEKHCRTMGTRRMECCTQSAQELEAIYPQFRKVMALAYAKDSGVLYKAGIMRALMDLGLASSLYGEEYRQLFGTRHAPGPVLHSPAYETVDDVLKLVQLCRGVVVFAHPSVYHSMELVRELAEQGRIDGVEIEHPRNTPEDKAELHQLAQAYNLIVTGGTDYHGMNTGKPHPLGTCTTEPEQLERIRALAQQRKER